MKLKQTALLVIGLLPFAAIAQTNTNKPPTTNAAPRPAPNFGTVPAKPPVSTEMPEKKRLSYSIGMYFARNITNSIVRGELSVDNAEVIAAISDVLNNKPTRLTEKEVTGVFDQLKAAMAAKKQAKDAEDKAKNEAFLAQFAKSAGVTTLSNGLEYKVIKEGTGSMPKEADSVTVAYRGTLSDGTEFDRNDNFPTPVKGGIIQGWQKILPMMKTGSKWQVAIPSNLGYGPRGRPPKIPGNAVLVFDMELKSVTPAPATLPPISAAPPSAGKPGNTLAPTPPAPGGPNTPVVSGEIIKVPSADELKKGAKIEVIQAGQTNTASSK